MKSIRFDVVLVLVASAIAFFMVFGKPENSYARGDQAGNGLGLSAPYPYPYPYPYYPYKNDVERVSVATGGTQGNSHSSWSSISADGRYVAFESDANNLVNGDTNGLTDIFVRDLQNGTTTRISIASNGTQANSQSYDATTSADGGIVGFDSFAENLVSDDTNGVADVFVRDRLSGTTERVSLNSDGAQANAYSMAPSISADGRYVAFYSYASNLIGSDTNGTADIFVRDRLNDLTTRISIATNGQDANAKSYGPSISANGRYVAFYSYASNLVAGDTNGTSDIFVYDRQSGITERVSVATGGEQGNAYAYDPSISADGRYVAFESFASNLVSGDTNGINDVFIHDRQSGTTLRISVASNGLEGNGYSDNPSISADGRYVTFSSYANNLASGDPNSGEDVYLHDMQVGSTVLVSRDRYGLAAGLAYWPTISADGSKVAFSSYQEFLVDNDTNMSADVFVRKMVTFTDASPSHWAWSYIQRLYGTGITSGCGTGLYCPEDSTNRAQMAVFLEKGMHGSSFVPPAVLPSFADTNGHWAANWIEALKNNGITSGCGGANYCPDSPVTRAQMAIFLLKAEHGSFYMPPSVGNSTGFSDVPTNHWAAAWIKQLALEGITSGCGGSNYCPESAVTRAQMAVFLTKTFKLP